MDLITFKNTNWNYYSQLETDFFSYSQYCEIDKDNGNAFSNRYLQLLISICSEIDTIAKVFCKLLDEALDKERCGISDYIRILNSKYPTLAQESVEIKGYIYPMVFPWKAIAKGYTPDFWQIYNKVKHHRCELTNKKENYKYANQKVVIEALAALYVIEVYLAAFYFVTDKTETENTYMIHFCSQRLNLSKWTFFETYMGQTPWFNSSRFFKYLEEEKGDHERKDICSKKE